MVFQQESTESGKKSLSVLCPSANLLRIVDEDISTGIFRQGAELTAISGSLITPTIHASRRAFLRSASRTRGASFCWHRRNHPRRIAHSGSCEVSTYRQILSTSIPIRSSPRYGIIPRVTRRLNDSERRTLVRSGAVFCYSIEESGVKRWTDGVLWSPSRVLGNFLVRQSLSIAMSSEGESSSVTGPALDRCTAKSCRPSPAEVEGSRACLMTALLVLRQRGCREINLTERWEV